jgi:hypothetical protein
MKMHLYFFPKASGTTVPQPDVSLSGNPAMNTRGGPLFNPFSTYGQQLIITVDYLKK